MTKFPFWFWDFEYSPWIEGHFHLPMCKRHRWVHHRDGRDRNIHLDELDLMEVDKRSLVWSQNLDSREQENVRLIWQTKNFNCSLIGSFVRSFLLFSFEKLWIWWTEWPAKPIYDIVCNNSGHRVHTWLQNRNNLSFCFQWVPLAIYNLHRCYWWMSGTKLLTNFEKINFKMSKWK